MKWKVREKVAGKISGSEVHPVVERLLLQRGIDETQKLEQFFSPDYDRDLHDPFLFAQMRAVVDRITRARDDKEKIGIFGDHDVDGISGATILHEALTELGIENEVYIPDKHTEGHGINEKAIEQFHKNGVTLMISVDCGSTNVDEVATAKKKGIDTIIIDHHNTPEVLPEAFAIINPKLPDAGYPFDGLCGTATAFKVVTALFQELLPEEVGQLKWLLDIVAIGTIADCMPLIDENRTIVHYGLLVLSKSRRVGYQELISVGRLPIGENQMPDARTVAFHIAPRLNAAGRMAHAEDAFFLLAEKDRTKATVRAQDLEEKNKKRRKITDTLVKEVDALAHEEFAERKSVVVAAEHYPVGVVGIIAGRIASTHQKPAAVFAKGDTESRGSFRSIENVNVAAALAACEDLLVKHGGHDQAAGATIANEYLDAFSERFEEAIATQMGAATIEQTLLADLELDGHHVDFDLAAQIKKFAPFGQDNEEPLFVLKDLVVLEKKLVGSGNKHLKLSLQPGANSPKVFDAIGFGLGAYYDTIKIGDVVDVVATVGENEWRGSKSLQLTLTDLKKQS